jgi:hypothetical protein
LTFQLKLRVTRKSYLLAAALILLFALAGFSEPPEARIATAERTWAAFWREFTLAINKKDHAALLRMMPSDFFDGGGGLTSKQWLKFIDANESNGSWRALRKSMAGGVKINRTWSAKGVPTKVTRDDGHYFEFRKDGKWYFAGVVGD